MGGVGQVACLGFLVREAVLVFWWVELEFFCHFQSCSLCFSFFCVLASSVSNFHPDTRGRWWTLFKAHLLCCGEEGTLQTNNTGMCSQCLSHTGFAPADGVCAFPVYTA